MHILYKGGYLTNCLNFCNITTHCAHQPVITARLKSVVVRSVLYVIEIILYQAEAPKCLIVSAIIVITIVHDLWFSIFSALLFFFDPRVGISSIRHHVAVAIFSIVIHWLFFDVKSIVFSPRRFFFDIQFSFLYSSTSFPSTFPILPIPPVSRRTRS